MVAAELEDVPLAHEAVELLKVYPVEQAHENGDVVLLAAAFSPQLMQFVAPAAVQLPHVGSQAVHFPELVVPLAEALVELVDDSKKNLAWQFRQFPLASHVTHPGLHLPQARVVVSCLYPLLQFSLAHEMLSEQSEQPSWQTTHFLVVVLK